MITPTDRWMHAWRPETRFLSLVLLALSSGCVSIPPDLGRSEVDAIVASRGLRSEAPSPSVLDGLMAEPLTAESAVQVALINNPGLQATYASLGIGAADLYEGGRIRNPVFSAVTLDSNVAGEANLITLSLVASLTGLLTLSSRKRLSRAQFTALQQAIGAEVMAVAGQAEKAHHQFVGAQQVAVLRAQVAKATGLAAALAERFSNAGNLTRKDLALERAAASHARLQALDAQSAAYAARTELADALGLSANDSWSVAGGLNLPIGDEDDVETLLALAVESRLDLAAARTQADLLADAAGVVEWTRWLGELDGGIERERETDGARLRGSTLDWEIPLFTQNKGASLRANANLEMAVSDVRRLMVEISNEVRRSHFDLMTARRRIEEYLTVLIPRRSEVVARAQEEVNYMLIGIFELIEIKQEEYDTYQEYLETIRDYWVARVELGMAVGATLPSTGKGAGEAVDVNDFIRPDSGAMDHSGHGGMEPPAGSAGASKVDHSHDEMTLKHHDGEGR